MWPFRRRAADAPTSGRRRRRRRGAAAGARRLAHGRAAAPRAGDAAVDDRPRLRAVAGHPRPTAVPRQPARTTSTRCAPAGTVDGLAVPRPGVADGAVRTYAAPAVAAQRITSADEPGAAGRAHGRPIVTPRRAVRRRSTVDRRRPSAPARDPPAVGDARRHRHHRRRRDRRTQVRPDGRPADPRAARPPVAATDDGATTGRRRTRSPSDHCSASGRRIADRRRTTTRRRPPARRRRSTGSAAPAVSRCSAASSCRRRAAPRPAMRIGHAAAVRRPSRRRSAARDPDGRRPASTPATEVPAARRRRACPVGRPPGARRPRVDPGRPIAERADPADHPVPAGLDDRARRRARGDDGRDASRPSPSARRSDAPRRRPGRAGVRRPRSSAATRSRRRPRPSGAVVEPPGATPSRRTAASTVVGAAPAVQRTVFDTPTSAAADAADVDGRPDAGGDRGQRPTSIAAPTTRHSDRRRPVRAPTADAPLVGSPRRSSTSRAGPTSHRPAPRPAAPRRTPGDARRHRRQPTWADEPAASRPSADARRRRCSGDRPPTLTVDWADASGAGRRRPRSRRGGSRRGDRARRHRQPTGRRHRSVGRPHLDRAARHAPSAASPDVIAGRRRRRRRAGRRSSQFGPPPTPTAPVAASFEPSPARGRRWRRRRGDVVRAARQPCSASVFGDEPATVHGPRPATVAVRPRHAPPRRPPPRRPRATGGATAGRSEAEIARAVPGPCTRNCAAAWLATCCSTASAPATAPTSASDREVHHEHRRPSRHRRQRLLRGAHRRPRPRRLHRLRRPRLRGRHRAARGGRRRTPSSTSSRAASSTRNVKLTRPVNADTAKIAAWFASMNGIVQAHPGPDHRQEPRRQAGVHVDARRRRPGAVDRAVAVGRLAEGRHRDAGARPPRLPRTGWADMAVPTATTLAKAQLDLREPVEGRASSFKPGSRLDGDDVRLQPEGLQHGAAGGLELQAAEEAGRAAGVHRHPAAHARRRDVPRRHRRATTGDVRRPIDTLLVDGAPDREVDEQPARRSRRSSCSRGAATKPFVGVVKSVTSTLTLFRPDGQPGAGHVQGVDAGVPTDPPQAEPDVGRPAQHRAPTRSCSATRWRRSPTPSTGRRRCGGRSPPPTGSRTRSTCASVASCCSPPPADAAALA